MSQIQKTEGLLKVFIGCRITLPLKWRERHGIKEGDFVKCIYNGNELRLIPVRVVIEEKRS